MHHSDVQPPMDREKNKFMTLDLRIIILKPKIVQPDQNMMIPQMGNSHEFRLVQVSSYSGQAVLFKIDFEINVLSVFFKFIFVSRERVTQRRKRRKIST